MRAQFQPVRIFFINDDVCFFLSETSLLVKKSSCHTDQELVANTQKMCTGKKGVHQERLL